MDYLDFLRQKRKQPIPSGFTVADSDINPLLFPFQRDCVRWACHLGKSALFEERGLGKTIQELEWARQVVSYTGGKVLILAPLAVAFQHLDEASKFGYELTYCETQADVGDLSVVITNYERLEHFDPSQFAGVVLDESSILKAFMGATKQYIINAFKDTPYKLAASATPAPNDHLELGNHAQFLGVMNSNEMIARWFINDTQKAGEYRLKKHAAKDFWRWVTSWAVCLSHPRDLGEQYDLAGYDLPALHIHEHEIGITDATLERIHNEGRLIPTGRPSSTELNKVKRESLSERVKVARAIVDGLPAGEPVILWCDTNEEADMLMEAFPQAIEVRGSHSHKIKQERLKGFTHGEFSQIITKADIAGMGLNWQHCAYQIFTGLNYSFERFYQALGRSYRYGQTREVHAYLLYSDSESNVLDTLRRKQGDFTEMQQAMNAAMHEHGLFRDTADNRLITSVGTIPIILPDWLCQKEYA